MAKTDLKTRPNDESVSDFLKSVVDEKQRIDGLRLVEIFKTASGKEPEMWGSSIVGFGRRLLKYASGRELDWMISGFAPRKGTFALYGLTGTEQAIELLSKLGKHKTGKGCLYIKNLTDIDESILDQLVRLSIF